MNRDNLKFSLQRLLDWPFLLALGALLLNDHVWKAAFHNGVTGKLSDFTGLYAFAWVGLCLAGPLRKFVPWVVAALFIWWKSPFSQGAIDAWNSLMPLQLARVVDAADLLALAVLQLAAWRFRSMELKPWQQAMPAIGKWSLLTVAAFAFVATSAKSQFEYNETHALTLSPQEVVATLNAINHAQELGNPGLSLAHARANDFRQEGEIRLYRHHNKEIEVYYDTTFAQIDDSVFVDEIRRYEVPAVDSIYVNPDGHFIWHFATEGIGISDTVANCRTFEAILNLQAQGSGSKLRLERILFDNCINALNASKQDDLAAACKLAFEKSILLPLRQAQNVVH